MKKEYAKKEYTLKRAKNMLFLFLAYNLPLTKFQRTYFYKYAGINIQSGLPTAIGKVSFDTLHPEKSFYWRRFSNNGWLYYSLHLGK